MSTENTLNRRIGFYSAIALVVSNMIGVGIFTSSGFLAGDLADPALVICIWFVGAAIALIGALCYSELSINLPRSGGEYMYLTEAWGPAWGFVDGWVSFVAGFSAPIANAAIAIAAYLAYFNPALDPSATVWAVGWDSFGLRIGWGQVLAAALVVVFTAGNLVRVETAARLQNVLTLFKLAVLGLLIVLGFTIGDGNAEFLSTNAERTSDRAIWAQFAVSLIFVYYVYSGWNAAVYVAEEIKEPRKTLPRALLIGTALVAVIYAVLNVLFIYASGLEDMKGVLAVGSQAAENLFGPAGGALFSAGMAISLLATVNAMCLIGPRVYYAMARDGAFFAAAARLHPRWQTPWVAIVAQGAFCCVLILTGEFERLAYFIGFTLALFTAFSILGLFRLRKRPGWEPLPAVSFAWPLMPSLYILANLWCFLYFAVERRLEAVWALATIVVGALAYHLYARQRRTSS